MREFVTRREASRELRPRDAAYLIIALWLTAVVVWGTLEHLIEPEQFPTVWLGMWWALQTVTTVGYGDVVPETSGGRAAAWLLLLGGLAFITVVTGAITSAFVQRAQRLQEASGEDPQMQRLAQLDDRLDRIERRLAALGGEEPERPPPPAAG